MKQQRRPGRRQTGYSEPLFALETGELAARVREITRRLVEHYGEPAWSDKDPLSQLVDVLLSHRTRDEQTAAAYANLRARFGSWEALRDAPTAAVQQAIANVNWPEVKAPRLQAILRQISAERGSLDLSFLCALPVAEGMAWLSRFEGVGPKTAACVLLFSCRQPVLPVDVHVHRISQRLGLIEQQLSPEAAQPLLQALLPPEARTIYNFHKGLVWHGQRRCFFAKPLCQTCFLRDLCQYYQSRSSPARPPTASAQPERPGHGSAQDSPR